MIAAAKRMVADGAGQVRGMSDAPIDRPTDAMVHSEPLGDDDVVIDNEPAGATASRGGGEFPDPDTPPSGLAPADGSPERGHGTFDEAYASVDEETRASGS
jgi:hypothetical protein